jgi:hypothetical protein
MANTLASGASARKGLEVQLLSWAFTRNRSKDLSKKPNSVRLFLLLDRYFRANFVGLPAL